MENNTNTNEKIKDWRLKNPTRIDCISVHIYMEISHFFRFIREQVSPLIRQLKKDSRLKGFHFLCYPKDNSYITLRIFSNSGKDFFDEVEIKEKIEEFLELNYINKIVREDYDTPEKDFGNRKTRDAYENWLTNNSNFLIELIDYDNTKTSIPKYHNNLDISYSFFISHLAHMFFYQAGIGQNEVQLALTNAKSRVIDSISQDFDQIIQKYGFNKINPVNFGINN